MKHRTKMYKEGYVDGVRDAIEEATKIAEQWQQSDMSDWHGGVAASRAILERLNELLKVVVKRDTGVVS